MRFTLLCYLPSILFIAYSLIQPQTAHGVQEREAARVLAWLLSWPSTFVVAVYWIARVVRRAWGDGSSQATTRKAGWIYPEQR